MLRQAGPEDGRRTGGEDLSSGGWSIAVRRGSDLLVGRIAHGAAGTRSVIHKRAEPASRRQRRVTETGQFNRRPFVARLNFAQLPLAVVHALGQLYECHSGLDTSPS